MRIHNKQTVILLVLILVINLVTLMRFPGPNGDEAWMSSRALEIIESGNSFGELDRGVLDKYAGYENFNPWLSSAIQSIGIRIFGTPSLFAIRFISLIAGFILLIAVFWIGNALDGKMLGFLSVAFTAFSWTFLLSSHLGRPDIIAAAFGYSSLALYLNNHHSKIWVSSLIGILAVLAFEVHPNGIIYCLTIGTLFFFRYKWDTQKKPDFWGFVAGSVIGIIIYFILHIFPNPRTYFKLSQLVFSSTHIPPLFSLNLSVILNGFGDMVIMIILLCPQILIGILFVNRFRKNRRPYITTLVVINLLLLLGFLLLVRNKFFPHYAIHYITG